MCSTRTGEPWLERSSPAEGVEVLTPHLAPGLDPAAVEAQLRAMVDEAVGPRGAAVRWYYTPMMLPFSRASARRLHGLRLHGRAGQLHASRRPNCSPLERELLARADLVFTGGYSLYEAKRDRPPDGPPVPVERRSRAFRARARGAIDEPADQARLPRPRLGFYGVIDERMDLELLAALADARPDWSIVMVGPVVKIDRGRPAAARQHPLPRRQDLCRAARLPARLGRGADAVRDQRGDPLHQPDQDARIPRRRPAGGLDPDHRRDPPLRRARRRSRSPTTPDEFVAACERALALARERARRGSTRPTSCSSQTGWDATVSAHVRR